MAECDSNDEGLTDSLNIDLKKDNDQVPKSQSPPNDDSGGYYLPDFITNEIEGHKGQKS